MRINDPLDGAKEIFVGGRIFNEHWPTLDLTIINDHVDGVIEKQLAFTGWRQQGRSTCRRLWASFFEALEVGQHIFLYGIEITLHAFLRMTLLEFGDQRRDEHAH